MEYIEKVESIEIPRGTGEEGLFHALHRILQQPRLSKIVYEKGKVTYYRFALEGENDRDLELDFETVTPYSIIRNAQLEEPEGIPCTNASTAVAYLFNRALVHQLHPIAFVGGANSSFFKWHKQTSMELVVEDSAYGLPFYRDRHLEDSVLFLCASYTRNGRLIDTRRGYKLTMPF